MSEFEDMAYREAYYKGTIRAILFTLVLMKEPKDLVEAMRFRRIVERCQDALDKFQEKDNREVSPLPYEQGA